MREFAGQFVFAAIGQDVQHLIQVLPDLGLAVDFVQQLNSWEVRCHEPTGHWAMLAHAVCSHLPDIAPYACLKRMHRDRWGHSFYQVVSDADADQLEGKPLTLQHLEEDRSAWIGG